MSMHIATRRLTPWQRLGLIALLLVVVGASIKYAVKASYIRGDGQTRSAFLRWRGQILSLDESVNIYQQFNYPNPPIMAMMLYPFAKLPPLPGALIWFYVKVGMAVLSLLWAMRMVECRAGPLPTWARAWIILFSLHPILSDLSHGNVNILILFLVVSTVYAYQQGRDRVAGLVLALAIACKVTPALFVFYFAWKRSWRVLIWCALGMALFLLILPGVALGWEWNLTLFQTWLDRMVYPFLIEGFVTSEHPNQSIPGFVYRLFTEHPSFIEYVNDQPVPAAYHHFTNIGTTAAQLLVKGCMAIFALLVVLLCRAAVHPAEGSTVASRATVRHRSGLAPEFAMIVLGMLLFSERTWKHHAVTLAIPYAVIFGQLATQWGHRFWRTYLLGSLTLVVILTTGTSSGIIGDRASDLAQTYGVYTFAFLILTLAVIAILTEQAIGQVPLWRPGMRGWKRWQQLWPGHRATT